MTRILVRSPKALIDRPVVLDRDLMLRVPAVHRRAGRGALAASGQPLDTTQAHSKWRRCADRARSAAGVGAAVFASVIAGRRYLE
jgi:hypothetical protein